MNLLFDIGHPGQVHLFRNAIGILRERGHNITVTVKDLPSARQLLDACGIPWISLGKKYDALLLKGLSQARYNYRLWKINALQYDRAILNAQRIASSCVLNSDYPTNFPSVQSLNI